MTMSFTSTARSNSCFRLARKWGIPVVLLLSWLPGVLAASSDEHATAQARRNDTIGKQAQRLRKVLAKEDAYKILGHSMEYTLPEEFQNVPPPLPADGSKDDPSNPVNFTFLHELAKKGKILKKFHITRYYSPTNSGHMKAYKDYQKTEAGRKDGGDAKRSYNYEGTYILQKVVWGQCYYDKTCTNSVVYSHQTPLTKEAEEYVNNYCQEKIARNPERAKSSRTNYFVYTREPDTPYPKELRMDLLFQTWSEIRPGIAVFTKGLGKENTKLHVGILAMYNGRKVRLLKAADNTKWWVQSTEWDGYKTKPDWSGYETRGDCELAKATDLRPLTMTHVICNGSDRSRTTFGAAVEGNTTCNKYVCVQVKKKEGSGEEHPCWVDAYGQEYQPSLFQKPISVKKLPANGVEGKIIQKIQDLEYINGEVSEGKEQWLVSIPVDGEKINIPLLRENIEPENGWRFWGKTLGDKWRVRMGYCYGKSKVKFTDMYNVRGLEWDDAKPGTILAARNATPQPPVKQQPRKETLKPGTRVCVREIGKGKIKEYDPLTAAYRIEFDMAMVESHWRVKGGGKSTETAKGIIMQENSDDSVNIKFTDGLFQSDLPKEWIVSRVRLESGENYSDEFKNLLRILKHDTFERNCLEIIG